MLMTSVHAASDSDNLTIQRELLVLVTLEGNENLRGFVIDPVLEQSLNARNWRVTGCGYGQLTQAHLDAADAVVMIQQPYTVNVEGLAAFEQATPLLHEYVRGGGGLFVILDDRYFLVLETINRFIEPFGAVNPRHSILESNPARKGTLKNSPTVNYILTSNLDRNHPVTAGIGTLAIPQGADKQMLHPVVFKTGQENAWHPVVRGEETASSRDTENDGETSYDKAPVMMAVREVNPGKGRLAILPMHSTLGFLHGSHPRWDNGFFFEHGQQALLMNTIEWLAASPHKPHGEMPVVDLSKRLRIQFPPVDNEGRSPITSWQEGVLIELSEEPEDLENWVEALSPLLDWAALIIPDSAIPSAEDYARWEARCAAASREDFLIIPSVRMLDSFENAVAILKPHKWPMERQTRAVNHISREVIGHPVLLNPESNPWPAVNIGGFQGIVYAEYSQGALVREYGRVFNFLQGLDWFLIPHALFRNSTPLQTAEALRSKAWRAQVAAPEPGMTPDHLPYLFHNERMISLSKGPVFRHAGLAGPGLLNDPWEGQYYFWDGPDDHATYMVEIDSLPPDAEIRILRNGEVWRNYRADSDSWAREITFASTQASYSYWTEIYSGDACIAISPVARTRAREHWAHGGGDRMNLYHNMMVEHPLGISEIRDRIYTLSGAVLFNLGWGDDARIQPAVPSHLRSPAGREWGAPAGGILSMRFSPYANFDGIHEFTIAKPARAGYSLASEDMAILEEHIELKEKKIDGLRRVVPSELFKVKTRYSVPRWVNEGIVAVVVEMEAVALRDISPGQPLDIRFFELVGRSPDWFRKLMTKSNTSGLTVRDIPLEKSDGRLSVKNIDWALLYPDPQGVIIMLPLDGSACDVEVMSSSKGPRLRLWTTLPQGLSKGETLHQKYIIATTSGLEVGQIDTALEAIGLWQGLPDSLDLTQGRLVQWQGLVELASENGIVAGTFSLPNASALLPVQINGLHDFQPAVWRDLDTGAINIMQTHQDRAYRSLPCNSEHKFAAGAALDGAPSTLHIDLVDLNANSVVFTAHNPLAKALTATLAPSEALGFKTQPQTITIPPNEDLTIRFFRTGVQH